MKKLNSTLELAIIVTAFVTVTLVSTMVFGNTPEGAWTLKTGRLSVTVESWGKHCGDKPRASQDRQGAQYRLQGDQLIGVGGVRPIFEPGICKKATGLPSLREVASSTQYLCATAAGAGTQVRGTITKTVLGSSGLRIDHTFKYEWRLRGDHCQLQTKGRWTLQSEAAQNAVPVESTTAVKTKPSKPKRPPDSNRGKRKKWEKAARCQKPGRASSMASDQFIWTKKGVTTTYYNQVEPGATPTLDAKLVDKNGCDARGKIRWSTERGHVTKAGVLQTGGLEVGARFIVQAKYRRIVRHLPFEISAFPKGFLPAPRALRTQVPKALTQPAVESRSQGTPTKLQLAALICLIIGISILLFRRKRMKAGRSVG